MKRLSRRVGVSLAVVGAAVALTFVGAVATVPGTGAVPVPDRAVAGVQVGRGGGNDVALLQDRLRERPEDWQGWAALGNAYVEQARVSGDPSSYGKAEAALERSLAVRADGNADAITGQAALAAARHDFAAALALAERAQQVDSFNPPALGIVGDALVELGRYDDAFAAIEQLNSMKPGFPAYSRASYAWELRGDTERATEAMEQALHAAGSLGQATFAAYYLGQLAFDEGDLDAAQARFEVGLEREPDSPALLAGSARVAAAQGDIQTAVRDYTASVGTLPNPSVIAELGDLYASLGRDSEAQDQYDVVRATQQLLAAAGQDVDLELSLFDADHGRHADALESAEAAYATRASIFTQDALAWSLYRNGRPAEALPHAQAALRLGTRSAVLHYHLGMIQSALGDTQGAREQLERALAINPYFSTLHAPLAEAELDGLPSTD